MALVAEQPPRLRPGTSSTMPIYSRSADAALTVGGRADARGDVLVPCHHRWMALACLSRLVFLDINRLSAPLHHAGN